MTKIIQISDCHLFADQTKTGYNQVNPYLSLKTLLVAVKNQQPDMVLATGDISGDYSAESYQYFFELMRQAKLETRLYVIPGNHDDINEMLENLPISNLWLDRSILPLPERWRIHLLNTQYQHTYGRLSESDLSLLEQNLSKNKQGFDLLVTHHHPVPCNGWMDKHQWQNRQEFTAIVDKYQSVKAVIYGHIHMATETQIKHCRYMACPSTCWQYAADQAKFTTSQLSPGFRVINLSENGQIDTSVVRIKR